MNEEETKKVEKIAKEIAKENGQSESMWELFLPEAYSKLFNLNKNDQRK